ALDHGLVVIAGGGPRPAIQFAHALLQETIAAELLPRERARAHAAYAEAIERDPTLVASGAAAVAELARHWDGAGRLDRAIEASVHAAEAADGINAFTDAARLYGRAVELASELAARGEDIGAARRSELLHRAAAASSLSGRFGRAVELGRLALATAIEAPGGEVTTG